MGQLYINDVLMDFSERTIVAATKQVSDIGSIDKVKGNTTNQFKLPLTKKNIETLGLPGDLNFSKGYEYQLLKAKYIENGVEIIPYGFGVIVAVNENIEIKILDGNTEFFDLLDGSIRDLFDSAFETSLGLPSLNHFWNKATIIASLQNTSGYIYPMIDYGGLGATRYVNAKELRPAVYIHTIIDRIFKKTGFTPISEVFSDPDFLSEILPFAGDKLEQPDGYGGAFYAKSTKTSQQFNTSGKWFRVNLPNTPATAGGYWNGNRYTFLQNATVKFNVKAFVNANLSGTRPYKIGLRKNGEGTSVPQPVGGPIIIPVLFASIEAMVSDSQTSTEFESEEIAFNAGDYIEMWAWREGAPFHKSFYVDPGTFVETLMGAALYGSEVSVQKMLPDHSIKDTLKNWMYRYCLIAQTDNVKKTVTFKPFSDVNKNILQAPDWSEKIDMSEVTQREFTIGSYAQSNVFAMKADENVPEGLGNGVISINDKTLDLTKTIVTSLYAASQTIYKLNGNQVISIKKISDADLEVGKLDFTIKTTDRIARVSFKSSTLS